jgi:hypothetical protein
MFLSWASLHPITRPQWATNLVKWGVSYCNALPLRNFCIPNPPPGTCQIGGSESSVLTYWYSLIRRVSSPHPFPWETAPTGGGGSWKSVSVSIAHRHSMSSSHDQSSMLCSLHIIIQLVP